MATARKIHLDANLPPISINSNYVPSSQGCFMQQSDTLSFTNDAGNTIDIKFEPNPVYPNQVIFTDIIGLTSRASSTPQSPSVANGSVNYYVYMNGVKQSGGPYAIQVGTGPMYVQIHTTAGAIQCTPDPVAIARTTAGGGTLEMVSADITYYIGPASFSNMFLPPLTQANVGVANNVSHTDIAPSGSYPYTVSDTSPKLGAGGGGTVKIKNT